MGEGAGDAGGSVGGPVGEVWGRLGERIAAVAAELGAAGDRGVPTDDRTQAEGARHLARQLVFALQGELEFADPRHPVFHRYEEPWVQWGGPNPDNVYLRARIHPELTYRVHGDVSGVKQAIFSLVEGDMHLGQLGVYSEHTLDQFDVGPDGHLDVVVSPDTHPGNWMPMDAQARYLLVRQYQSDWERDRIASLTIECDGTPPDSAPGPAPFPTMAVVAGALDRAATWVETSVRYWADYMRGASGMAPNTFGPPATPPGGAPNIAYGAGWWNLDADQALLITFERPDSHYWSWTIHNHWWFDSGDFSNRQTSLNDAQTFVDGDGVVRLVAARTDPGVPNWIDLEDRPEGLLVYRYVGARTRPVPEARVVDLASVRDHVPEDHPFVESGDRRRVLARRRAAALGRYA